MTEAISANFSSISDLLNMYSDCETRAYMLSQAMMNVNISADKINVLQIMPPKDGKRKRLHPVFLDDVDWGRHYVTEYKGVVYDPLLGRPMPKDLYLNTMFEDETRETLRVREYTMQSALDNFPLAKEFC